MYREQIPLCTNLTVVNELRTDAFQLKLTKMLEMLYFHPHTHCDYTTGTAAHLEYISRVPCIGQRHLIGGPGAKVASLK